MYQQKYQQAYRSSKSSANKIKQSSKQSDVCELPKNVSFSSANTPALSLLILLIILFSCKSEADYKKLHPASEYHVASPQKQLTHVTTLQPEGQRSFTATATRSLSLNGVENILQPTNSETFFCVESRTS